MNFLRLLDLVACAADSTWPGVRQHFACKGERSKILPSVSVVPDIVGMFKL